MKHSASIVLASMCITATLSAQEIAPPQRVRLDLISRSIVGEYLGRSNDSLLLRPESRRDTLRIAEAEIKGAERSAGIHGHAIKSMLIGAGIGAGLGAIIGHALAPSSGGDCPFCHVTPATASAAFAGVGVILGAPLGALRGATDRKERWDRLDHPTFRP
jgi:hypothetical protein